MFDSFPDIFGGSGSGGGGGSGSSRHKDERKARNRDEDTRRQRRHSDRDRDRQRRKRRELERYNEDYDNNRSISNTTDFRPPKLTHDDKRFFYTSSFPENNLLLLEGPEISTIPRYRRSGRGRVLGLPRDMRISEKVHYTTRNIILPSSNALRSLRSSKTRMPAPESDVRRIRCSNSDLKTGDDFVPVVSDRRKAKEREAHQRGFLTLDVDYRGVKGPSKPGAIDEDVHPSSSDDSSEEDSNNTRYNDTLNKRIEWDRYLKTSPQDVQGWLDYVDFQSDIVTHQHNEFNRKTAQNVVLDLQYQVLDKALSHQPRNLDLVVKKLQCGAKGSREGLGKDFRIAIHNHKGKPGVYRIWKAYIDYAQCYASIIAPGELFPNEYDSLCSFEIVSRIYMDAFRDLIDMSDLTHLADIAAEDNLLQLFFRYCSFLLSAGYTERVYSLYQAMFELNFRGVHLNKLGELWYDYKYRRVGDELTDAEDVYQLEYPTHPNFQLEEWHEYEKFNDDIDNAFPVAGEQNNSDDPFRNVIWEVDLLPYLFSLRGYSSRMRLADSLLNVFGIGVALSGLNTNHPLLHDSLLQGSSNYNEFFEDSSHLSFNQPQYVNTLFPFSDCPTIIHNEHLGNLQRIIDDLGITHLQMLLCKDDNRKLKHLLAANPDKKDLYDIYARIQYGKGKIEAARKVYSECLKGTGDDETNKVKLCYSWSHMELVQGNRNAALNVLCDGITVGVVDDVTREQSSINTLKARKLWSSQDSSAAFEAVSCRALFELLVSNSVDKAVSIYEESLKNLDKPSYAHEVLTSELVRFVDALDKLHDADRSVQLPSTSTTKRILRGAISEYPYNTFFSYSYYTAKTKLDGYRQLFDEEVAENAHSVVYIQAVMNIMDKKRVSNTSLLNRVRRVFTMGTLSQDAQHSVALWKLYFQFEWHVASDYKLAEQVIINSLRYCLWSKQLHMLLFDLSNKTQVESHLLQVLTLMDKYGMRLRIDPSPYIRRAVELEISKGEGLHVEPLSENSDEEMFM
ncbi:hypothetical protein E3P78_02421 [Wallemia ichthyophaga]|nr:hypothetical protein E3P78_02421 [Wallemia ichthyophaga]